MNTNHLLICTLLVSGCTLAQEPPVPIVPAQVPISAVEEYVPPYCPLERVEVALLPRDNDGGGHPPTMLAKSTSLLKKPARALTPIQLVSQAQKDARIEPSARGYYGNSGEHVYSWAAGKVYTVYLTKKHATGIFLPPGERLVSGLYLDQDMYEVKTVMAGTDAGAYDALYIRPLTDSGEVNAFLLTESGKRYLLHFVVGNVGMLAVTFEGARIASQARGSEPALTLPRPAQ